MMVSLSLSVALPEQTPDAERVFMNVVSPAIFQGTDTPDLIVDAILWEKLWHYLQTKTLSKSGIDISEVGTTWMGSLEDANASRNLSSKDVIRLGGRESFSDAALTNAVETGDRGLMSVPWFTDTRVIYYWRDMLSAANISTDDAFSTATQIKLTMEKLHRAGFGGWGVITSSINTTVHQVASWIWAAGKDFISPDGKRTEFCDRRAINGIFEYFSLCRYMPQRFDSFESLLDAFINKSVAAVMCGPWFFSHVLESTIRSSELRNISVSLPPGAPFLGGSNLVIWNHIDEGKIEAALKLLERLLSMKVQSQIAGSNGLLPVRKELLHRHPYTHPVYQEIINAQKTGRPLPRCSMWGPLEVSLVNAFAVIWKRVKTGGTNELKDIIQRHLEPLANRYDKILAIF